MPIGRIQISVDRNYGTMGGIGQRAPRREPVWDCRLGWNIGPAPGRTPTSGCLPAPGCTTGSRGSPGAQSAVAAAVARAAARAAAASAVTAAAPTIVALSIAIMAALMWPALMGTADASTSFYPDLLDRAGSPQEVPDSVVARTELWTEFCMGLQAEEAGDLEKALRAYQSVELIAGENAELLARQATCYLEMRQPERAAQLARRAAELDTLNTDALWAAGAGLLATGKLPDAVPYLSRLGDLDSSYRNLSILTNLLERLRRYEEALETINLLVAKSPSSPQLLERRASFYTRLGRYDEAIADYWAILEISPEYPKLREQMTTLLKQVGRHGELIRFYQALTRKLPDEKHNHWRLIELLMEAEQWDAAAAELATLRGSHPDDPLPVLQLGLVAYRQGQIHEALDLIYEADQLGIAPAITTLWRMRIHYAQDHADSALTAARQLTDIEPQAIEGWRVAGYVLAEQGASADALTYVERWLALDESDPEPALLAAALCRQLQAWDRGLAFARTALEQDPENDLIKLEYAGFLEAAGELEKAAGMAREILDRDSQHPEALNFLGYLWVEQGTRLDEAEKLIGQALKSQPENPAFLDSMGWLWYKRGDLDRAEKWLNRAIASGGRHPEIYRHLAQVILELGRIAEAQEVLELGLKWNPRDAALSDFLMSLGDER